LHLVDAGIKRLLRNIQQFLRLRRYFANARSEGRVSHPSIEHGPTIYGHDVSGFQLPVLARNTMHQFLIDAYGDGARKWRVAIAFERRYTSVFLQHFLSSRVEVSSRNTWF
jgi:hypothetical protein